MKLDYVDGGRGFDWGRASKDYAKYRDIYPQEFYDSILKLGVCTKGQRVLDVGTGTGVLPRNLYRYGASFVGVDIAENQVKQGRKLAAEQGMDIEFLAAPAETLDFLNESFDAVTACMCFVYFDKTRLLPNLHRMLKADGSFSILSMIWLPRESGIAAYSESLILKYNPQWTGGGYERLPHPIPEGSEPWFCEAGRADFDVSIPFSREGWHGRMRACRGIGASSMAPEEIAAFEQEHRAYLNTLPETFEIPHYVSILKLQKI